MPLTLRHARLPVGLLSLATLASAWSNACSSPQDSGSGGASSVEATGSSTVGGGGDAGLTDGGPKDGGSTGSACPYAYCENFDEYKPGLIENTHAFGPWLPAINGPSTQVDSDHAKSSPNALHITSLAKAGGFATLNQVNGFGLVPGNDLFGRVEVFYSNAVTDAGTDGLAGTHAWFFRASGDLPDGGTLELDVSAADTLGAHTNQPGLGNPFISGGMMTAGAWHCVQWQFAGSGSASGNVVNVWLDGALVANVPATKDWIFPTPWNSFDLGFSFVNVSHPVEVYLDDFALDGEMIPCPP